MEKKDRTKTNGGERQGLVKQLVVSAILVVVLVALDQITKVLAQQNLPGNPVVLIPGVFELHYIENHGAAFSILQDARWLFILLTAVILLVIVVFQLKMDTDRRGLQGRILTAILMAGAIGNLIDRIMMGCVRDFLYFKLIDFPIFNVADICVTVSAFILIIWILFDNSDKGRTDEALVGKDQSIVTDELAAEE